MPAPFSISPRLEELEELIEATPSGGRWLVLTHDNPDPDALTSAVLLGRLLRRRFHQKVTLAYGGLIGRAENRELARVLGAKLSHLRHLNWKRYARFALVDAQPRTGNNQLPADLPPHVVFDHHPPRPGLKGVPFVEVRPGYGATATLLAEYLAAAEVPLTKALSTALIYAIRSETQEFGREYSAPDKAVYDQHLPRVDRRALAKIQNARLPLSYFETLHEALEHLEGVDTLVVSHLGAVEQPDIVPEIADLLLRLEGKTWSLVTGRFEARLYLSIRTTNPRADAGALMRRLVGRKGKGGGHGMMAGGWVALEDPEALKGLQTQMGRKLARLLRKKPERLQPLALGSG